MAFDGTLKFDTAIDKTGFQVGIGQLGNLAKTGMAALTTAVTAGAAAATAGIAAIGKQALDAYGDYEQLVGGVETLFGAGGRSLEEYAKSVGKTVDAISDEYAELMQAQQDVLDHASDAYKTAGMSANAYMETVTSFSASLLQSLGGDTQAAAEKADMAITDMSDNANKMGTSMELIQNAYQGFAKANYTMLDNLKLGYGGTKEEMVRLLEDAQAISGIEYDLEFGDVVDAIHVIQKEMGISGISAKEAAELVASGAMTQEEAFELMGTTAKEAATTIQGSMSMASAAWENFLTGLGDEDADLSELAKQLTDSVVTAAGNIAPVAVTILRSMAESVAEYLPDMADAAMDLISDHAPAMADAGKKLLSALGDALLDGIDHLPDMAKMGISVITQMVSGIRKHKDTISSTAVEICTLLVESSLELAPDLIGLGMELLTSLTQGFADAAPELLTAAETGLKETADVVKQNLPEFAQAGMSLLSTIGEGVLENLPELVSAAVTAVSEFCDTLLMPENLELLMQSGYEILTTVMDSVLENLPELVSTVIGLIQFFTQELLSADNILTLIDTAAELLMTIVNAIVDNADEIFLAAEEVIQTLCDELTTPENFSKLVEISSALIAELVVGLCELGGKFLGFAALLYEEIDAVIKETDWGAIGISIVEGICSGLLGCDFELDSYLEDFGDNWVSGIKELFGIHSPSKLMKDSVGKNLALGIGEGFADEAGQIGKDITQAVTEWTAVLPSEARSAAESFLQNTDDLFTELPSTIAARLEESLDRTLDWGADLVQAGAEIAEGFLVDVQTHLQNLPDLAQRILDSSLGKVVQWGVSLADRGRAAASELVQGIGDVVDTLPDKLASIGRNLVEGLWNGITGMGNWLQGQISGFADSVLSGFMEAFGIHSPSTVMRDCVGKYLALGIGEGFMEEIPQVGLDAVKAFADLELPEITIPDFDLPDIDDLEIEPPEIDTPDMDDLEITIPDIKLPDMDVLEIRVPDFDFPDFDTPDAPKPTAVGLPAVHAGAVQAIRSHRPDASAAVPAPSPTSSIINNHYSYSTVNRTMQTEQERPITNLYVTLEVDGEILADASAERIDEKQGEKIELITRGVSV